MTPTNPYQSALDLTARYSDLDGEALLRIMIDNIFKKKICLVSSFGAEAAVLLSMVAQIDQTVPIIFIDTKKLFPETLKYRDQLVNHLSLKDVRTYYPNYSDITRNDADGTLWRSNTNGCCYMRKVKPLERALKDFDAWITGRKRFHGGKRIDMPLIESSNGKIKINPLANWDRKKIEVHFEDFALPRHSLVKEGYPSIGCMPCTDQVDDDNIRSGRWAGQNKTECGIHLEGNGKFAPNNTE